jgi:hypothetical protein
MQWLVFLWQQAITTELVPVICSFSSEIKCIMYDTTKPMFNSTRNFPVTGKIDDLCHEVILISWDEIKPGEHNILGTLITDQR